MGIGGRGGVRTHDDVVAAFFYGHGFVVAGFVAGGIRIVGS